MARRKQAVVEEVPQSQAEAAALVAAFVATDRRALELAIGFQIDIDILEAQRDKALAEIDATQKSRFAALKAWWEAGGKDLAGKKRSAELAGATLGVRLSTPAVKFGKGWNAAKVLTWLGSLRWAEKGRFIRTKTEFDKQAVIKAIAEPDVARTLRTVLEVVQTDEFFIDTGLDEAAVRKQLEG